MRRCLDGEIVRGCDEPAAFGEAAKSIENGVDAPQRVAAADIRGRLAGSGRGVGGGMAGLGGVRVGV